MELIQLQRHQVEWVVPLFDAYRQFYGQPSDLIAARQFLTERLERNESAIFVAMQEGKALGFTQLYPSFSSVSLGAIYILNDLFVSEESRHQGVGLALLKAAREFARQQGATRLSLSTAHTNAQAQRLYERDGWQQDREFLYYDFKLAGKTV